MRCDSLSLFSQWIKEASASFLPSLYLFISKDSWEIEQASFLLFSALLPKEPLTKDQRLLSFDAQELQEAKLAALFESQTLFAKQPLIWLKGCDKAKKNIQERIEKEARRLKKGDYLLLSASSLAKSHALYQLVEKLGCVIDFPELKPWEREKRLIEWASSRLKKERKLMNYPVLEALVKRTGGDPYLLASEMEKLFCYTLEEREVRLSHLEALGITEETHTVWQLGEAIFRGATLDALLMGREFLTNGQALLPLLRQLRTQFQTLYQLSFLLIAGQKEAIAKQFPYMKGAILERNIEHTRRYGREKLKLGILKVDECEKKIKNSVADEALLLELLIYELINRPLA